MVASMVLASFVSGEAGSFSFIVGGEGTKKFTIMENLVAPAELTS